MGCWLVSVDLAESIFNFIKIFSCVKCLYIELSDYLSWYKVLDWGGSENNEDRWAGIEKMCICVFGFVNCIGEHIWWY